MCRKEMDIFCQSGNFLLHLGIMKHWFIEAYKLHSKGVLVYVPVTFKKFDRAGTVSHYVTFWPWSIQFLSNP